MILIGISGKKKSGKDEVCKYIRDTAGHTRCDRIAFADALKEEVAFNYRVTTQYIEEHKDNFRLILQGHGTDYRRKLCGDDYWIKRTMVTILKSEASVVVIPDVRFKNEADFIKETGGFLFRVERPSLPVDSHPSECDLDDYKDFDKIILNDKTILRLHTEVDVALEQLNITL